MRVSHAAMRMRRSIRRSLSSSRISLPSRKLEGKTGRKFANYSQVCTKRRTITAPFGRSYPPSSQCTSEPGVAQPRLAAGHPRITPKPACDFTTFSYSVSHDLWGEVLAFSRVFIRFETPSGTGLAPRLFAHGDGKRNQLSGPRGNVGVSFPPSAGPACCCLRFDKYKGDAG